MQSDFIYGLHVVRRFLKSHPDQLLDIFLSESREDKRIQEIIQLATAQGMTIQSVSKKQLDQWFPEMNHQGIAARVRFKPGLTEKDLPLLIENAKTKPLFLVLDGVQDPHNLGACLRTADACGVTAVIIPKDRSASVTSVVRKVASGAAEVVPIVTVTNLARCLQTLKELEVWIIGTEENAKESLYDVDLKGSVALVLGAEGTGLRRLTEEQCDVLMQIPMRGVVESLNVSVAVGVCLYEVLRQRGQ